MRQLIISVLLVLLTWSCDTPPTAETDESPSPNVLFILVDDLGYHDLGTTGSTFYETPNIDRLAATSLRFGHAYAGSRVCSPSRATLMLGQYTATHGITDWIGARSGTDWRNNNRFTTHLPPEYVRALPDSATTLAEAFRQNGYRNFFAGKWHLGGAGSMPTDHGFDVNVAGHHRGSPPGGFFDPYQNPELANRRPGENLSMRLADETTQFITDHITTPPPSEGAGGGAREPFFAMLSFYAVHAPIQTTEARWRHYRDKAVAAGVADRAFEMERRLPIRTVQDNPVYAGLVEQMDLAVGHVLDALDSLDIADNTIVVFTSDNGGVASGDNYSTSNLPLRGGKGYQWEGGTREPFFLRVGDRYPPATIETRITGADLYPTLVSLAGLEVDPVQEIEGEDLTPLIEGGTLSERPLFWHYPHYGNQGGDPSSVIIRGDWKLIHYWEDGRDELYGLGGGAQEQFDMAKDYPDRVAAMRTELLAFLKERDAGLPVPDPEYDAGRAAEKDRFFRTTKREELEAERAAMFGEGWVPNEDWWGSGTGD
jgi:arylsulfatase A-like enzyme